MSLQHENLTTSVHYAVRPLHPAEQRARFLVLPPLVEYSAAGTYVVISSQEGEIPLIADSLEWFEWFRTLSSFRGCRESRVTLELAVDMIVVQHACGMPIVASISMSTSTT